MNIKKFIGLFIYLFFTIFTFIFSFFISADTTQKDGIYNEYIKPFLIYKLPVIVVLVLFFIIMSIYEYFRVNKNDEIQNLKNENKEYKQLIESKSINLLNNLKELVALHKKEKLLEFIKNYALNNPYVIAIQIYSYTYKHNKDITKYQVNYIDGYVRNDEEENSISQLFYTIKRSSTKKFSEAYIDYIRNGNSTKLRDFAENVISRLDRKQTERINDEDCNLYALALYSFQVLGEEDSDDILYILTDYNKEQYIQKKRRTGILCGIINQDFYRFYYAGNNDKKSGRSYVTFCKEFGIVNYLFLITLSPAIDLNGDTNILNSYVNNFVDNLNGFEI